MALKATIYKANIELADMDRNYYDSLNLTIAQHPSETPQRLMVRLVAYLLNAHPDLQFGKGVSNEEEAAIWQKDYSDTINVWIELGQLDEKRLKKACNQASEVKLYCYGSSSDTWWSQVENSLQKFDKLSVAQFDVATCEALAKLLDRNMSFQCSIQDGQMWLNAGDETLLISLNQLK